MIDIFNIHSIYRPILIARENTANENTDGIISRFKSTSNFYDRVHGTRFDVGGLKKMLKNM